MRILIVDDESASREQCRQLLLSYFPTQSICGEAASVAEAFEAAVVHMPDLVLLDVDMPDGTAFDFLRKFGQVNFRIIFITAYEKYALQAIKFSALDYLLKPYTVDEFVEAIQKAIQYEASMGTAMQISTLIQNLSQPKSPEKIVLRTAESINVVQLDDIVRIQADSSYSIFHFVNRRPMTISKNLKEYEQVLENSGFIRTHQSHLVNLMHVKCFKKADGGWLELADNQTAPVATRFRDKVLSVISRM